MSSTTQPSMSTEPKLLATVKDLVENATTTIADVLSTTTEAFTGINVENGTTSANNIFGNISSAITTSSAGLTDSIIANQTVTEAVLNQETVTGDIFVSVSSNISVITPGIDTDQSASQTTISDILTSLSSNITSDSPGINTNQTFTDAITESIFDTESTASDIITSLSSNISTGSSELTSKEVDTTVSSVFSNVTESFAKNVTGVFTTTYSNVTDTYDHDDVTSTNDVVIYVILGLLIALLIIIVIISYIFCKKCKGQYSKSGDYYITQYTSSTTC